MRDMCSKAESTSNLEATACKQFFYNLRRLFSYFMSMVVGTTVIPEIEIDFKTHFEVLLVSDMSDVYLQYIQIP